MRSLSNSSLALVLLSVLLIPACAPVAKTNEQAISAEGPIRLHPENPHYFLYRGEALALVTSAEHYGAVLNREFDYTRYLDTMAAEGMNYTRIFSGYYSEKQGSFGIENNTLAPSEGQLLAPWLRSDQPGYANGGNKFDLERWDPAYFERLKSFISYAEEKEIIVELTLFCSFYNTNWEYSPLHADNNINGLQRVEQGVVNTLNNGELLALQEQMVRKLVSELNDFDNLFFEIQNEPYADHPVVSAPLNPLLRDWDKNWQNRVDLASAESLAWQAHMTEVIVDEESKLAKKHLVAQNYCNYGYPLESVHPGVSILNFHYAYPEAVSRNYGYDRAIGFDESGFSGNTDEAYRRQAWKFMMAGGSLFNSLDYSFFVGAEDGTGKNNAPGGGSPALRAQLRILKEFVHSFDLRRLRPDHDFVVLAPGTQHWALSVPGSAYGAYFEGKPGKQVQLTLPSGDWEFKWVHPETGESAGGGSLKSAGGRTALEFPPFEGEVALKLQAPGE